MMRFSLSTVVAILVSLSPRFARAQSITQGVWGHVDIPGALPTDVTVRLFTSPPTSTDLPDVTAPVTDPLGTWEASVAPGTWYVQACHDLQGALNCRDLATPIFTHRDDMTGEPLPIVVYASQVTGPIDFAFRPCATDPDCPAGPLCLRTTCAAGGGTPLCSTRPQAEGSSCGSLLLCTMYGTCVATMPVIGDVVVTQDILDSEDATWQADFTATGGYADWSLSWGDGADEDGRIPSPVSASHRYDKLGTFYLNGNFCGTLVEGAEGDICAPIPTRKVVVRDDDATPPTINLSGSTGTESASAPHTLVWAMSDASGLSSVTVRTSFGLRPPASSFWSTASPPGRVPFLGCVPSLSSSEGLSRLGSTGTFRRTRSTSGR